MGSSSSREFGHVRLTRASALALREAVRPFATLADHETPRDFCRRLYLAIYEFEADDDVETVDLAVSREDVFVINHFTSAEDGDWAKDLLHQTRQALYEHETGREAVRLVSRTAISRLLDGVE